jgi:hypothetical protein
MILGIAFGRNTKAAFGRYHAVQTREPYTTAAACTAWDQLPLEHAGIPVDEAEPSYYFRADCGAELPHDRLDVRWVAGTQVTCPRCGAPPHP